ncbi:MAG: hypothetical protein M0Q38_05305 [Bacteroidales bacterium]|nr:hypothetical protein [Bacteroidales bacterium]
MTVSRTTQPYRTTTTLAKATFATFSPSSFFILHPASSIGSVATLYPASCIQHPSHIATTNI